MVVVVVVEVVVEVVVPAVTVATSFDRASELETTAARPAVTLTHDRQVNRVSSVGSRVSKVLF